MADPAGFLKHPRELPTLAAVASLWAAAGDDYEDGLTALLDGLLQCRGCGGKTYAARHRARGQEVGQYVCAGRTRGISACRTGPDCSWSSS